MAPRVEHRLAGLIAPWRAVFFLFVCMYVYNRYVVCSLSVCLSACQKLFFKLCVGGGVPLVVYCLGYVGFRITHRQVPPPGTGRTSPHFS